MEFLGKTFSGICNNVPFFVAKTKSGRCCIFPGLLFDSLLGTYAELWYQYSILLDSEKCVHFLYSEVGKIETACDI